MKIEFDSYGEVTIPFSIPSEEARNYIYDIGKFFKSKDYDKDWMKFFKFKPSSDLKNLAVKQFELKEKTKYNRKLNKEEIYMQKEIDYTMYSYSNDISERDSFKEVEIFLKEGSI